MPGLRGLLSALRHRTAEDGGLPLHGLGREAAVGQHVLPPWPEQDQRAAARGSVQGEVVVVGTLSVVVVPGVVVGVVAVVVGTTGTLGAVVGIVVGTSGITGAVVGKVETVVVAAVGTVEGVPLLSSCDSSSASRTPTMIASTPAAISTWSGPRRRRKVVPQAGQNSASCATGFPQIAQGWTATGAPPGCVS